MYSEMKCKKCRISIFTENDVKQLVDAHNKPLSTEEDECETVKNGSNVYLTTYTLPSWLLTQIEAEEWKKGKLLCPKCQTKIGAFNYISGLKCQCSKSELAPIYFVKSKVDLIKNPNYVNS